MLKTREAYLVKRRSIPDSDVSRFTLHERRTERTTFLNVLHGCSPLVPQQ
jgi:hypothetical protein